ncbi:unnamed protein product [Mytilus coruscus]|uniref:Uncharacterized protein n=1 Tax=Mytilus coruscus TaxID=42192 RepID=A0A6J8DPR0_MYTCO|nr:unnamed protein product [Mytilus coruscus]
MPLYELRATFLIELLVLLLYNSNGNNWWITESEAVHAFVEGRHMSVDSKCFADFQLTYNMACILNSFYEEKYPSFRSVIATVFKRSGVLYYVRNDTLNHTVPEMKKVITFNEGMLESWSVINILIGVVNMLSGLDVDHTCHELELLRECYIKLSNIDESNQNYYITQALYTRALEKTRHKNRNERPFIKYGSKIQIECDAVREQITPPEYQRENQILTQRNSIRNVIDERLESLVERLVGIDSLRLSIESERHHERLSIERERLSIEKERLNGAKKTNETLERLVLQLQITR